MMLRCGIEAPREPPEDDDPMYDHIEFEILLLTNHDVLETQRDMSVSRVR